MFRVFELEAEAEHITATLIILETASLLKPD